MGHMHKMRVGFVAGPEGEAWGVVSKCSEGRDWTLYKLCILMIANLWLCIFS